MAKGDHIFVKRFGYSHHGIDVGDGQVIHYTGEPGHKSDASIKKTLIKEFTCDGVVEVVKYSKCLPIDETIALAEERIGENTYNLIFCNCEHFARFCKTKHHKSEQVKDAVGGGGAAIGSGVAVSGSITAVSAAGSAAGLSGPGVMAGLAAIGPAGAIGGIVTLAAIPAVVTNIAVSKTLSDDKNLPDEERRLRRTGRIIAKVGTAAGAVGTVGAISTAGTTAGLSAAGITSGLAAIGGTVGGGMVAGVAISVAAPAVVAAATGWGIYKIRKWLKKK
jgi:hypothetical protein